MKVQVATKQSLDVDGRMCEPGEVINSIDPKDARNARLLERGSIVEVATRKRGRNKPAEKTAPTDPAKTGSESTEEK